MRQYVGLCVAGVGVALLAASASAQTFKYTEDFNSVPDGTVPPGWSVKTTLSNPNITPRVMTTDPASWGTACTGGAAPDGCGRLGVLQDYSLPWSGGGRFSLIHPGWDASAADAGWAGVAWFSGSGATYTGTYPLAMKSNRLKAQFDMIVRSGDDRCGTTPADGGVFAILPVTDFATDITRIGGGGGAEGWGGLTGLAVEFDIYDNGSTVDPSGDDAANHIGLDVFLKWTGNDLPSLVTELDPPLSLPPGVLPRFVNVGDNNQPLHITIFYNDDRLGGGGAGVVQVYLKVDPADAADGNGISFGMETGAMDPDNPSVPLGALVLQACVGPWPTESAIFGMTGSVGGCNSVYQIDNVKVETNAVTGDACVPTQISEFQPGPSVVLTESPVVADCTQANLTEQGWDVRTYLTPGAFPLDQAKGAIAWAESTVGPYASAHAVPDINFNNIGCNGLLGDDRQFPGMPPASLGWGINYFSMFAKGWICFPVAGSFPLNITSDDDFELYIGNQLVASFTGGRGCATFSTPEVPDVAGTSFNLTVNTPGVYPVFLVYTQGSGDAGIEFRRRFKLDSLLLKGNDIAIGAPVAAYPDQPVVYTRMGGQAVPDPSFTPAQPSGLLTLSPAQKVNGSLAGEPGLKTSIVHSTIQLTGPYSGGGADIWYSREGDGRYDGALRWLDFINPIGGGGVLAYTDVSGTGDGSVSGGLKPPGYIGSDMEQYIIRMEGYVQLDAGMYIFQTDHDDELFINIGEQTIFARTGCCTRRIWQLYVPESGVYPIRIDGTEGGGGDHWELTRIEPDMGLPVALGDKAKGSTISLATDVTANAYVWKGYGTPIPADRKVADVGQGQDLGWNAKVGGPSLGGIGNPAYGTAQVEASLAGFTDTIPTATATPYDVNIVGVGESGKGWFGSNETSISTFLKSDGTPLFVDNPDNIGGSVSGYVEFTKAGNYGIGIAGDDGITLWVGGKIIGIFPYGTGAQDQTVCEVYIAEPGIYDIRADNYDGCCDYGFELYQYAADNTRVLVNSDQATFKVYRTLKSSASSTKYANPVRLPESAKVGDRGGDLGIRVQIVNATWPAINSDGNGDNPTAGRDTFRNVWQATEMLDHVLNGAPSFKETGSLVSDFVWTAGLEFSDGENGAGFPPSDPPSGPVNRPNNDDFAVRLSGYLELSAGGHVLICSSDDGFDFWIGGAVTDPKNGWNVGQSGSLKGGNDVPFYVWVPVKGLYPFQLDYLERGGGNVLNFREAVWKDGGFIVEPINGGTGLSARAYVTATPCGMPFADSDKDGDVDLVDFGVFQACFTGSPVGGETPAMSPECSCFDQNRDSYIDTTDFEGFRKCFTGPTVKWTNDAFTDCVP